MQSSPGCHTASVALNACGHVTEQMRQASANRMDAYIHMVSEAKRENKRETAPENNKGALKSLDFKAPEVVRVSLKDL